MAKKISLQQLLLDEVQNISKELKEVRQTDIPNIHVQIEKFDQKIKALDRQQTWSTRIYTVIGGAIAVGISMLTGHKQ